MKIQKILIVGAAGKTGQRLLAHLADTPYQVSGLIRKPEQADSITQFNAEPLLGDLTQDVNNLPEGFDAVIFVAGSKGKDIQGVDYQGIEKMVNAAQQAGGVKRFLYIGSLNTGKSPEEYIVETQRYYQSIGEEMPELVLKTLERPGYHDYVEVKQKAEQAILDSGINYTILRAGLLTEEPGSGKVSATKGRLNAFGVSSRNNMAACFIATLNNPNTFNKIYTVIDGDTPIVEAFE